MSLPFHEMLSSGMVTFEIGDTTMDSSNGFSSDDVQATKFEVYKQAITQLSAPLAAMFAVPMSENLTGRVVWEDVTNETFVAFVQFAYTGDYSVLQGKVAGASTVVGPDKSPGKAPPIVQYTALRCPHCLAGDDIQTDKLGLRPLCCRFCYSLTVEPVTCSNNNNKKKVLTKQAPSRRVKATKAFHDRSYLLVAPPNALASSYGIPASFLPAEHVSSSSLILHASLHALATPYMIHPLQALALKKLHLTLCSINVLDSNIIKEVVALARYVYKEDIGKDDRQEKGVDVTGIGALRDMVCQYLIANMQVLKKEASFRELLREAGSLATDLWDLELEDEDE